MRARAHVFLSHLESLEILGGMKIILISGGRVIRKRTDLRTALTLQVGDYSIFMRCGNERFHLEFIRKPAHNHFILTNVAREAHEMQIMDQYVSQLLQKEAVCPVPLDQRGKGLPSSNSGFTRFRLPRIQHFKTKYKQSLKEAINLGDWMCTLDLKDIYLHVPMALMCPKVCMGSSASTVWLVVVVVRAILLLEDLLFIARDRSTVLDHQV